MLFCIPVVGLLVSTFGVYRAYRFGLSSLLKGVYFTLFVISGAITFAMCVMWSTTLLGIR